MKRTVILALFACFSVLSEAADIPCVVLGNEHEDQQACLAEANEDCISTICFNSPDADCSENCKSDAQDKCEEMADE